VIGPPSPGRVALTAAAAALAVAVALRLTTTRPTGGAAASAAAASAATSGLEGILDELRRLQDRLRQASHPLEIQELSRAVGALGERGHGLLDRGPEPPRSR
jgi:hypothetical protein